MRRGSQAQAAECVNATRPSTYAGTAAPRSGSKADRQARAAVTFSAWRSFHGRSPASFWLPCEERRLARAGQPAIRDFETGSRNPWSRSAMAQSPPRLADIPRSAERFQFIYPEDSAGHRQAPDNGFGDRPPRFGSQILGGVHARRIILGGERFLTTGPPRLICKPAGWAI